MHKGQQSLHYVYTVKQEMFNIIISYLIATNFVFTVFVLLLGRISEH